MSHNEWPGMSRDSGDSDINDESMDEILASIRRIIAEEPIGSRPHPLGEPVGRASQPFQSGPESYTPPPHGQTSMKPSGRLGFGQDRSHVPPRPPLARAPTDALPAAFDTDIEDLFEAAPLAVPAPVSRNGMPRLSERLARLAEPEIDSLPPQETAVPALAEQTARAANEATLEDQGWPFPTSASASEPATANGPVILAASPTEDCAVEDLLSRLAASLSAQATQVHDDDEAAARVAVAEAVAAVAAANAGNAIAVQPLPDASTESAGDEPVEPQAATAGSISPLASQLSVEGLLGEPAASGEAAAEAADAGDHQASSSTAPVAAKVPVTAATIDAAEPSEVAIIDVALPAVATAQPMPPPDDTPAPLASAAEDEVASQTDTIEPFEVTQHAASQAAAIPQPNELASVPPAVPAPGGELLVATAAATSASATPATMMSEPDKVARPNGAAAPEEGGAACTSVPKSVSRSLEDTVSELLRPLLREWLDVHMPQMLEKALREELAQRLPSAPQSPVSRADASG